MAVNVQRPISYDYPTGVSTKTIRPVTAPGYVFWGTRFAQTNKPPRVYLPARIGPRPAVLIVGTIKSRPAS